MPRVNDSNLTPDAAIEQGCCPECGKKLDRQTAINHARDHWGSDPAGPQLSPEARRRFSLVVAFSQSGKQARRFAGGGLSSGQAELPQLSGEPNKGVERFLETFGGIMIAAGFEWLIFVEHPSAVIVTGFIAGGIGVFFAGAYWESIKLRIPDFLTRSIETVALDFRYWMALVFAGWLSMLFLSAVQKIRIADTMNTIYSETKQLRTDLDRYAMPRRVTDEQRKQIIDYLSDKPPQTLGIKFIDDDRESAQYASDLYETFTAAKWKVSLSGVPFQEVKTKGSSQVEGLTVSTEGTRSNTDTLLHQALDQANILIVSSSGSSGTGPSSVTLYVGRRIRIHMPRTKEVPDESGEYH